MSGKEHQGCGVAHSSLQQLTAASRRDSPYAPSALSLFVLCACAVTAFAWAPLAAAEEPLLLARMLHESPSVDVRARAAAAIGRHRDAGKRPDLEVALADQNPRVRAAAANALGKIGSRASLPPLTEVTHDRSKTVAAEALQAIHSIETRGPLPRNEPKAASLIGGSPDPAPGGVVVPPSARVNVVNASPVLSTEPASARYGLMLGEMRNQSAYREAELVHTLGAAVERNIKRFAAVAIFAGKQLEQMSAAQARGLGVFRMDGSVTSMSATTLDGQLWLHCEVLLLVMERSTGLLRSVLKGAAHGVEVEEPRSEHSAQKRTMAQRVLEAAVRSALRNADAAFDDALNRSTTIPVPVLSKNKI